MYLYISHINKLIPYFLKCMQSISTSKINYIKHNPTNTYYFCYNLHDAILLYKYSTSKLNTTINGRMDEGLKKLCLLPVKDMKCIHYKN